MSMVMVADASRVSSTAAATATAQAPALQDSIPVTYRSVWKTFRNQFHPRPAQDDRPRDWWFASTAIPLIAAATAPFANVMSIVALSTPWRSTIHYDEISNDGLPLQIPYDDSPWYGGCHKRALYMLRSECQGCGTQCDIPRLRCHREHLSIVQFHRSGEIYRRTARIYHTLVAGDGSCKLSELGIILSRTLTPPVGRNHIGRPPPRSPQSPPSVIHQRILFCHHCSLSLFFQHSDFDYQSPRVFARPLPTALRAVEQPANTDSANHCIWDMAGRGSSHLPETHWTFVFRRIVLL